MGLEKLTILVEDESQFEHFSPEIEVLFNPNQVTIQKSTNWKTVPTAQRDVPHSQFTHGQPAILSLELFFDTYASREDVRSHTEKLFHLTTVEKHGEIHRPPLCRLIWGQFRFNDWTWILESLNQRFNLFLENGRPVRATLGCSFKQWRSAEMEEKVQDKRSADVQKNWTVQAGENLSFIAGRALNDPALWRHIAEANNIDNPLALNPGDILVIPKVGA